MIRCLDPGSRCPIRSLAAESRSVWQRRVTESVSGRAGSGSGKPGSVVQAGLSPQPGTLRDDH
eukprot:768793-Hanusia_phi.AAC.12